MGKNYYLKMKKKYDRECIEKRQTNMIFGQREIIRETGKISLTHRIPAGQSIEQLVQALQVQGGRQDGLRAFRFRLRQNKG